MRYTFGLSWFNLLDGANFMCSIATYLPARDKVKIWPCLTWENDLKKCVIRPEQKNCSNSYTPKLLWKCCFNILLLFMLVSTWTTFSSAEVPMHVQVKILRVRTKLVGDSAGVPSGIVFCRAEDDVADTSHRVPWIDVVHFQGSSKSIWKIIIIMNCK